MTIERIIFHVDMDAFFAAIEQFDRPELLGKAVLVGGDGPRGVVAAANYEARRFGCHSAQPMAIAKRNCPRAIIVPVRGRRYRQVSRMVFDVFDSYTPLVQPLSIDEAFLDMTGTRRLMGSPRDVAMRLKRDIQDATGLTGSVGIAPNMFLAKLASDIDKPDALTIVTADMIDTWLPTLPIEKLWGVGPSMAHKLHAMGLRTVADVRKLAAEQMTRAFGEFGEHVHRLAHGIDPRHVTPDRDARSIGQEQTFAVDVAEREEVRRVLLSQCEQVARRLRKHELLARTVTIKIRYGDFQTITRSQTLDEPTDLTDELWRHADALFRKWADASFAPVRLIGVTANQLGKGGQMGLFERPDRERRHAVDAATDRIVDKFGQGAIRRGGPGA
jgi:DNA polymerase-4